MSGPLVEIAYFRRVCLELLAPYLRLFGFSQVVVKHDGLEARHRVAFSNDEVLLDFSYWPEDFPTYCVMVGIGFIDGELVLERSQIGLWCAIPPDKRVQTSFRTEQELVTVMTIIRDEILPCYARPLWTDLQLLSQLITRCYNEQEARDELAETEKKRLQAEAAFRNGEYGRVVSIYAELSPVDLTPTDQKRLAIARKRLK
jgi:hypothetical protein